MIPPKRDFRVYLAGPMFTSGRLTKNIHDALKIADRLRAAGFQVFIPHLYAFYDAISPHEVAFWLEADKHWLEACDLLFCIPGASVGGNMEEGWARDACIPILTPETMGEVGSWISRLIARVDDGTYVRRAV